VLDIEGYIHQIEATRFLKVLPSRQRKMPAETLRFL